MTPLRIVKVMVVVVIGLWGGQAFAADPSDKRPQQTAERNWQISFTPSYSHGNFGTNTTSEFIYAPFSIRRLFSKGDVSLVIPSVTAITDGRTTVVGNTAFRVDDNSGSNSGSGGGGGSDDNCRRDNSGSGNSNDVPCGTTTRIAGQKVTTTGIGDVILRGRYYLVEEQDYVPLIAVTARLKLPTANASQGLGTGEFDHGYGVEVSKLIGTSWLVFFDGGTILSAIRIERMAPVHSVFAISIGMILVPVTTSQKTFSPVCISRSIVHLSLVYPTPEMYFSRRTIDYRQLGG